MPPAPRLEILSRHVGISKAYHTIQQTSFHQHHTYIFLYYVYHGLYGLATNYHWYEIDIFARSGRWEGTEKGVDCIPHNTSRDRNSSRWENPFRAEKWKNIPES